jgi:predicted N-formylglutamate amidohydrolase
MAKLTRPAESTSGQPVQGENGAFRLLRPAGEPGLLLVCDHATNRIPQQLGTLGLSEAERATHIAWDIGAAALTEALSERLEAPAVLANFSRLVADPNRGLDDPTLITALSDGILIPGNRNLTREAREARIAQFYAPYHAAIAEALARAKKAHRSPVIFSIHSFTPVWRGVMRPWHLGILWNKDDRVVSPLLKRLRAEGSFVVGDNEPYSGELPGDTMDRHGTAQGLAHALIEVRQDLVAEPADVASLAGRLAPILRAAVADAGFAARASGKEARA